MLHPLDLTGYTKSRRWCVPSAVSLLTGATLADSTALLARIKAGSYAKLRRCWMEDAQIALLELGFKSVPVDLSARYAQTPTLKRYMRDQPTVERFHPVLIGVTGHALVSHFGLLFDNGAPKGATVADFGGTRRRVTTAFIVTKI